MTSLLIVLALGSLLGAPAGSSQTQPPQTPPRPTQPRPTPPKTASPTVALAVVVTDMTGNPLSGVQVQLTGPVEREGTTAQDGTLGLRTLRPGTYRLRFRHAEFTTLERELSVRAGQPANVAVALTPRPVEEMPPAPPKHDAAPPPAPSAPVPATRPAEALTMSIPSFLEKNFVRSEAVKTSVLACAPGGTARLLQIRDPLTDQSHPDADELLYVVAGEGAVRIGPQESKVAAGFFSVVPRGAQHSIRRQGRNPLIVVSILAGSPCTQ